MPPVRRFPNLPDVHCSGEALGSFVHQHGLQWAVTADGVDRRDGSAVAADASAEVDDAHLDMVMGSFRMALCEARERGRAVN